MDRCEFVAPYPPSLNRMYRQWQGRTLISKDGRIYKEIVAEIAREQGFAEPIQDHVAIDIILHPVEPKDAAKRRKKHGELWHLDCRCIDVDNAMKPMLDCLQGVVYGNDSQIADLRIRRGLPILFGGMTVRVKAATWSEA